MISSASRRYHTAKKLQAAAIELAVRDGLTNITTEAISCAAGVSARTFFNYYPYKEAALMGPPPDYPEDAAETFVNSRGDLLSDLEKLITAHISRYLDEREMLGHLLRLSETDPKLMALRNNAVLARRGKMADLLRRRLPEADSRLIYILSSAIIAATNDATQRWASGEAEDFVQTALENLALILPAAQLLQKQH
ncbi:TetR/AcrR family transcriptional regulator [Paracoccus alkanivorans]|uniref:TetR/AcrR family transcriptional regulator n=1 Tax=Paracoccus alkanivorans TaxID=2116655 RepID=A0A3M0M8W5_9RHOB|nr:TetR/AcrR family transcriptional regulator [Paracoccus alkanivorans]RMC34238.1 TetR/AcrR family transcriptional regulator [Paracoccus alkanivorans]